MWILARSGKSQPLLQADSAKHKRAGSSSTEAFMMQNNTETAHFLEAVSMQMHDVKFWYNEEVVPCSLTPKIFAAG